MEFLEIRELGKRFGGVLALDAVSLEVRRGEIHSIIGENGAGKSTLLKVLSGTVKADDGGVFLEGRRLTSFHPNALFRRGISVAFQETSLFDNLTVSENLFIGRLYSHRGFGVNWRQETAQAEELLRRFGVTGLDPFQRVGELSAEHKQILEVLKAVKNDAKLVCLDEPTASLTRGGIRLLFELLQSLRSQGLTVIYVSHHLDEVLEISDRITVLRDGRRVDTIPREGATKQTLHALMIGHGLENRRTARNLEALRLGQVVLKAEDLGDGDRVRGVSFSVFQGEILGITGLVGAGRSELAWMLIGLRPFLGGRLTLFGRPVPSLTTEQAIEEGVFYLPEERRQMGLFLDQNLSLNTTISRLAKVQRGPRIDFARERELAGSMLAKMGVRYASLGQIALSLSGGNQQKLLLGKCLFADPRLLILDEPTKGIDVGSKDEIYALIEELTAQGVTIILISSEVEEIVRLADRVLVMGDGCIIGRFEGENISEREITACYLKTTAGR